ncbi:hypothetical protein PCO31110_04736 [Pandoraea communis]|uniref:Tetratricopeptide repeat protein n=1 Tax=Pandoraea communis TaxID=2508297 RepID=A0A5E4YQQ3_9BURK|nr:tetratricopeptide repeat protein [Pandoraea communis]VVE50827.1 hypothetical protein PCO31110_04736 [Pandoraea communis]
MSNKLELDVSTHEEIKALCAKGDRLAEAKSYEAAIAEYNKAWSLVPDPKNEWQASTWILAAIADACFLAGYKTSAREALEFAMTCPEAVGNPFLHLRLGQVLLDDGEEDVAANELMRAYMGGGEEIFASEDARYLDFVNTKAKL